MVVDLGVGRLLVDSALQIDHRRLILPLTELGPAERVLDIAVLGISGVGAGDHGGALLDPRARIDPQIAEVVQQGRIVGLHLQGGPQLGLRLGVPVQRFIGGAAQEMDLEALIRRVQQRAVQQLQRLFVPFHLQQLTGQHIGHRRLVRPHGGRAPQFNQGLVVAIDLGQADGHLHPGGGVGRRRRLADLGQGGAARRLDAALDQGLADQQLGVVAGRQVLCQTQIDGAELIGALGDHLVRGGAQRLGRALTVVHQGRRPGLGQDAFAALHDPAVGGAGGDGGVILSQGLVATAAPLQKLAIRQTEQGAGQGVAGQVAPFGVGLGVAAALLQQARAIAPRHQIADWVEISRRHGQGAVPVPGRRGDPGLNIEAGAVVRLAHRGGDQQGVGPARVAPGIGLHRLHQSPGLNDDRRDLGIGRGDEPRLVQVARQKGGGEGLLAHTRLLGRQGVDAGQVIGAGRALAAGQGVATGQVKAEGAVSMGVQRDRRPFGGNGRDLGFFGRLRFIGDDDVRNRVAVGLCVRLYVLRLGFRLPRRLLR